MTEELKPCPWCGYAARYIMGYGVQCTGCGASRPSTADEAIAAWNTRPPIVVTDDAETGFPVSGPAELDQKAIDDICEAVEDAVGSGSRAWDMIAPQDLCMAFYEQFKARNVLPAVDPAA